MALEPGTRLGPYEITAKLGAGGMGEVYRARDTALNRDVAIKVMPDALADDPDRLARFQREAEALAALNHPNIAQVYGLEKSGEVPAIVMELVDGEDLSEHVARGAMPIEGVLPIARQITEALEAAHERGIIHRDLKPANIKVRDDGTVKVLDFGLAKAMAPDSGPGAQDPANSPTLTARATQMGMILGTAAYMAPEQAKGKDVDKRADVWAFGVVLFEMLTGQRPFEGDDVSQVMARVIDREPDWSLLPEKTPSALRRLLRRALVKDRTGRLPDIVSARLEIDEATTEPTAMSAQTPLNDRASAASSGPHMIAAAVVAGLLVGLAAWFLWPTPEPLEVTQFEHLLMDGQRLRPRARGLVAVSPDGRQVVYNAAAGLYLRSMENSEARLISGTETDPAQPDAGLSNPVFSPDGQSVAFSHSGQLMKVPVGGGTPTLIGPVGRLTGMSWETDGTLLLAGGAGILRVPDTGGTPAVAVERGDGEQMADPQLLPNGDTVLVSATTSNWDVVNVVAVSLATGSRTVLVEGGRTARYLSTGHLVYAVGDELIARRFDADSLTFRSGPVPLVQGVPGWQGQATYAVSDAGTLVYVAGEGGALREMVWVDLDGNAEALPAPPRPYSEPTVSPDGRRVAVTIQDADNTNVWIWDVGRKTLTPLDLDPAVDMWPLWTLEDDHVVFLSRREGGGLFQKAADGTGEVKQLLRSDRSPGPFTWTADGRLVITLPKDDGGPARDILALSPEGRGSLQTILGEPFHEQRPAISPNGRWLAYGSREAGQNEIFLRPFPETDSGRVRVSTEGGQMPLWSAKGDELFYLTRNNLMAVSLTGNASDPVGKPEILFGLSDYLSVGAFGHYSVAPDGRFLFLRNAAREQGDRQSRLIIVRNWTEELKARVPGGR